jgi:hypothetical protein
MWEAGGRVQRRLPPPRLDGRADFNYTCSQPGGWAMGTIRAGMVTLAVLTAALPAQAVQNAKRPPSIGTARGACLSGPDEPEPADWPGPVPFYDGLGTADIDADTTNETAQRYFRQGLALVWGFDEAEGIRSFREAQRLDPDCALCFWGEAHARAPSINLHPRAGQYELAAAASAKAVARARPGKPGLASAYRGLIAATRIRSHGGPFDNVGYAEAMARLARDYPAEDPILILAAAARINQWAADRVPIEEVGDPAQAWLERVLERNPRHSGAIHFYIHLADTINRPIVAEHYADKLRAAAPKSTHLVHMASHSYYGVGNYPMAIRTNEEAIGAYEAFETLKPVSSNYRRYLYGHDHHYTIQAAVLRGDKATAIRFADRFLRIFPPASIQFRMRPAHYAAPWYVAGRERDVDEVLAMPTPGPGFSESEQALARVMRHYARGEAYARARTPDAAAILGEARAIGSVRDWPQGHALEGESAALSEIVQHVLEGRAAMIRGEHDRAQTAYRTAMLAQQGQDFDPPPFWYDVRRSLAAAMLGAGDAAGAKRQLDHLRWTQDPLAMLLYSRAERQLGNEQEAAYYLKAARAAWAGQDIERMPLSRIRREGLTAAHAAASLAGRWNSSSLSGCCSSPGSISSCRTALPRSSCCCATAPAARGPRPRRTRCSKAGRHPRGSSAAARRPTRRRIPRRSRSPPRPQCPPRLSARCSSGWSADGC